jgi:diacylglycerol kinase
MIVLLIWFFFKEVYRLLALMIFFASLVLFELAQTSIEHIIEDNQDTTIDDEPVQP